MLPIFLILLFVRIRVVNFVRVSNPSITLMLFSDKSKYSNCTQACNPHVLNNDNNNINKRNNKNNIKNIPFYFIPKKF